MNPIPFARRLRASGSLTALALSVLLTATAFAEVETLKLAKLDPLGGGVSETFSAEIDGQKWFFKKDAPVKSGGQIWLNYGNFEAEILAAKLFADFGFQTPKVRVVKLDGMEGQYLQAEWVDDAFTGGHPMVGLYEAMSHEAGLDEDRARLLLVLDTLIANGDRHGNNIFFIAAEGTKAVPLPIDHNLALATRAVVATGDWQLNFHRSIKYMDRFTGRNNLYRQLARAEGSRMKFIETAKAVQERITDEYLIELVEAIDPDAITFGDPEERKRDILAKLQARRDRLASAYERTPHVRDNKHDTEIALIDGIAADTFGGRLRLSSPQRHDLAAGLANARVANEDGTTQLDVREAYLAARSVIAHRLEAREFTKAVCAQAGVAFDLGAVLAVDHQIDRPGIGNRVIAPAQEAAAN